MLQNAYFLAKIGADTAENEQHFAEILPTDGARGGCVVNRTRTDALPRWNVPEAGAPRVPWSYQATGVGGQRPDCQRIFGVHRKAP